MVTRHFSISKLTKVVLLLCLLFFSCTDGLYAATGTISRLILSKNSVSLEVGDSLELIATALYENGTTENATIKTEWKSGSEQVASIYAGTITAKTEGTAVITASYMGLTEIVNVTVHKKVKALYKDKQSIDIRSGAQDQIKLTALYSDGTSEDATNKADWTIDNYAIATVMNGLVVGQSSGTANVTATYGSQTVSIPVTVEMIKRLDPDKTSVSLFVKETETIQLIATLSDGTTENVADKAVWSSDKPEVADAIKGVITGYGTGTAIITAKYGSKTATITVDVEVARKLEVDKPNLFMRTNTTQQVTVKATYEDGSSEDITNKVQWTSSNPIVVFVSNGKVSAYAPGEATITAIYGDKSVTIHVDIDVARKLEVNKPNLYMRANTTQPVTVTATYTDGSTEDITNKVQWTSSNADVAYVSNGKVSAYKTGEATITATYGDKSVTIMVDVDVPRNLQLSKTSLAMRTGDSETLTLTASYADGTSEDVTNKAEWTSSNQSVAFVVNGKVSAYTSGESTITAKYGNKIVTSAVAIDIPTKIQTSQDTVSMQVGNTQPLTVQAVYADGKVEDVTTKADWTISSSAVAEIRNGVITALGNGAATITIRYGNRAATVQLNVGVIKSFVADPVKLVMSKGDTKKITLTVNYTDGTKKDVTSIANVTSAQSAIASISDGTVTANSNGSTTITATFDSKTLTIPVEVDMAQTLEASLKLIVIGVNESKQITLQAKDAANNIRNVTNDAEWTSSNLTIATVDNGYVLGRTNGRVNITAKYGGKSVTIPVEVGILTKLEANVRYLSLKSGNKQQIKLTATLSDGTTKDVTSDAEWKTSQYKVADVYNGLVTANGYGKTSILIRYATKMITIPVEVDTLKYLKTNVVKVTLKKGTTKTITATATYADGTEANVSKPALWTSPKIQIADVKDGIIKANEVGVTNITVTYAGKKATVVVIVQN